MFSLIYLAQLYLLYANFSNITWNYMYKLSSSLKPAGQDLKTCIFHSREVTGLKVNYLSMMCEEPALPSLQIAVMLLENGADPNATDKLESTPLHRASAKGNYRLIQLLLKQSASTNIQDSQGNTALYV